MRKKTCRRKYGTRLLLLVAICLMMLAGSAAAYEIIIDAPLKVQRGMPLVVNGTSNLPAGISVDIVLYRSEYVTEEVDRQTVTLQGNKDFSVIFDTKDLIKGQYKVEVPGIAGYSYLGDSVTIRVVEIIDRSDEIVLRSLTTQEMDGTLEIWGYIKGLSNAGVQIEVIGPGNQVISGPEFISTQFDGSFTKEVPISAAGDYEISFTDANGYIGTVTVTVNEKQTLVTTIPTTTAPVRTVLSATAQSSNDEPAEFVVEAEAGSIKVYTSEGMDWVIEYTDTAGVRHKINEKGKVEAEEVIVETDGQTMYFKVYPYRLSASGEVTLYVEGATSVESAKAATDGTTGTTTSPTESPLWILLPIIAIALLVVWRMRR
jgi:hypothetical protein